MVSGDEVARHSEEHVQSFFGFVLRSSIFEGDFLFFVFLTIHQGYLVVLDDFPQETLSLQQLQHCWVLLC
jgi:hypothetical protein